MQAQNPIDLDKDEAEMFDPLPDANTADDDDIQQIDHNNMYSAPVYGLEENKQAKPFDLFSFQQKDDEPE